ncbi:hypothetical protein, partial [Mycoplasmopsis bovis]|uniref:hypothetical protein n=1 Tax=Mycoplasmopsis bovis TaxID=28903 RepID=UPI003D2B5E94
MWVLICHKESKLIVEVSEAGDVNFLVSNDYEYNVGDKIYFNLPTNRLHIFDKANDESLAQKLFFNFILYSFIIC